MLVSYKYVIQKMKKQLSIFVLAGLLAPPIHASSQESPAQRPGISSEEISRGFHQKASAIEACVMNELETGVSLPEQFTISFCVQNSGYASETELLERQVRQTTMASCIQETLEAEQTWPSYQGQVKCADFPIHLNG